MVLAGPNRVWTIKVLSTQDDYARGVVEGLIGLLNESQVPGDQVTQVAHATTIATNAVLERRGARTGLITTEGFRDILELRRMRFPDTYNLRWVKPPPLVDRYLRLEVSERIGGDGNVIQELNLPAARAAAHRLVEGEGVESIAVCLLNSYLNPIHERALGEVLRAAYPTVPVSLSSEVLPEIREFERTSTTVTNAYVRPVVSGYLKALESELLRIGIAAPIYVMQSSGGMMTSAAASALPVFILESGPAAGVIGAARLPETANKSDLITFDMGGTTAKAALIENGQPVLADEYEVGAPISVASRVLKGGGYLLRTPSIDLAEVGAGGGSVVRIDSVGRILVGPHSAGADPGPMCYGRGGLQPTVTDANVVLGCLNPFALAGGQFKIDASAAHRGLAALSERANLPPVELAYGIHRIANATMTRAIRAVSTARGHDLRRSTMVAFGGNGPVHACGIAQELGIRTVIVPPSPGVFSALGLLAADLERHFVQTMRCPLQHLDDKSLTRAFDQLGAVAGRALAQEGWPRLGREHLLAADLHYRGQWHEMTVPVSAGVKGMVGRMHDDFQRIYEVAYGHRQDDQVVELVNLRLRARLPSGRLPAPASATQVTPGANRHVYFGPELGLVMTPVISRQELANDHIEGPLVIEEYDATVVIHPGVDATLSDHGSVILTLKD